MNEKFKGIKIGYIIPKTCSYKDFWVMKPSTVKFEEKQSWIMDDEEN